MTDSEDPRSNVVHLVTSSVKLSLREKRIFELSQELFTQDERSLLFATLSHVHHSMEDGYLSGSISQELVENSRSLISKIIAGETPERQKEFLEAVKISSGGKFKLTITRNRKTDKT